jgi:hypothetical protein
MSPDYVKLMTSATPSESERRDGPNRANLCDPLRGRCWGSGPTFRSGVNKLGAPLRSARLGCAIVVAVLGCRVVGHAFLSTAPAKLEHPTRAYFGQVSAAGYRKRPVGDPGKVAPPRLTGNVFACPSIQDITALRKPLQREFPPTCQPGHIHRPRSSPPYRWSRL